jgi:hypothetical protein
MLYEVEIGAMVTIHITKSFPVDAETRAEAIEKAKKAFAKAIDAEYGYADYDEGDIELGYIGGL